MSTSPFVRSRQRTLFRALIIFLAVPAWGEPLGAWDERLIEAERQYDAEVMRAFIETLTGHEMSDSSPNLLIAEAYLALAEIYRIEYEALDESELGARREVGQKVDDAADAGLAIVEELAESSEQQRIMADLYGTKIRSNYRAKRFRDDMENAAARAVALDASNAAAYVSRAKPFLLAGEKHGGDIDRAMTLLKKALALNPESEKAALLLARAYEESGQPDRTEAMLEDILESNPNCRPAKDVLARLRSGESK